MITPSLPPGRRGAAEVSDTRVAIGNTQTMTGVPPLTLYHRWLGWHALAMRRAVTVLAVGLIVGFALAPFVTWGMTLVAGWDAASLAYLLTSWPVIVRADSVLATQLAVREDQTEGSARALLVGRAWPACSVSVTRFTWRGSRARCTGYR